MDRKLLLLLSFIVGVIFVGMQNQPPSHNLMTSDEAEAYLLFNDWQKEHGREYREVEEMSYRYQQFFTNFKFVKEHNRRYQLGLETFQVALNKFADLNNVEFKSLFTGIKKKEAAVTQECKGKIDILTNPPASVDWQSNKAVGDIRDQGLCGSCWAFSACGALEGLAAITTKKIPTYSPQQLVDCAGGPYGNEGCNGGDMDAAFWYVIDNGITDDSLYPYKEKDQKCIYTSKMKKFGISDCAEVPANKTVALESAVYKQPVSISVEADSLRFQFYSKGVFSGKCGTDLDHGIVLTGYGTDSGKDYWRCKNSWGNDWGEKGYIRIEKTDDDGPGKCGILMDNVVPLI